MRTFKKVLSVALVLAMAVSCFALTSLATEDSATVSYGDWVTVDGSTVDITNWTDSVDAKTASYDYRLGSDGENFYFSFRTKDSLDRASLGNDVFRIWVRDDATATVYTDFITVKVEESVFSVSNAKYNTSTTENKGETWSDENIAKINVSSAKDGDYTTVEVSFPFSILDKADESVDVWASYWPYALTGAKATTCLHSGAVGVLNNETGKVDGSKAPYTAWNADADATLPIAVSTDDPVGEADFGWDIVIPEGEAGDQIDVTITLKGLADDVKLGLFSMFVNFSDNLVPVTTTPADELDPFFEFATTAPQTAAGKDAWESTGGEYLADDNAYYLCFGSASAGAANGELVLTIPFKIADDAKDGDDLKVWISYDEDLAEKIDVTLENQADDLSTALDADTAEATVKVGVTDTSTDESVDISSSASSTPADSSSTPSTSDFGLAAIIVLAVAAVIGAAVIIRKRA